MTRKAESLICRGQIAAGGTESTAPAVSQATGLFVRNRSAAGGSLMVCLGCGVARRVPAGQSLLLLSLAPVGEVELRNVGPRQVRYELLVWVSSAEG